MSSIAVFQLEPATASMDGDRSREWCGGVTMGLSNMAERAGFEPCLLFPVNNLLILQNARIARNAAIANLRHV